MVIIKRQLTVVLNIASSEMDNNYNMDVEAGSGETTAGRQNYHVNVLHYENSLLRCNAFFNCVILLITGASRYAILPHVDDDDEWKYAMRRSMQEIIPGLYLGPYAAACKNGLNSMLEAGLTHVVCVRAQVESHLIKPNHPEHFKYLTITMDDSSLESIIPKVKEMSEFIDNCFNNNGKVLVHGNAGMSRSATLVVGYIMSKFGVGFQKANKYVQMKRFCICVKEAFMTQLREYEPIYMAMHSATTPVAGMSGAQFQTLKRTIGEIIENGDESNSAGRPRMDDNGTGAENSMDLD